MVAVVVAHQRPIAVEMAVARRYFARASRALDVVLQGEEEESSAVCRDFDTGPRVLAAQIQPVVIRADYVVVGGKLRIGAEVNRVLLRWQRLF